MDPILIGIVVFLCVLAATLLGVWLRGLLPAWHLNSQSRDVVKLVTGMIATVSAMVLGLLVASAKTSYDTTNDEFRRSAAQVVMLDRVLGEYGPDTQPVREMLRRGFATAIDDVFAKGAGVRSWNEAPGKDSLETLDRSIRELTPSSEMQRGLQVRALQLVGDLAGTRWLLVAHAGSSLSVPLLVVLVSWLAAIFLSFGLLAPRNATTVTALIVGALSIATAIFIIEELDRPLSGVLRMSPAPLESALDVLGR